MKLLRGIAVAGACALVLASCSDILGPADEEARLEKHQRLWNSRGVDSYRMTVHLYGAWINGKAVIEVRDGVPVSVTPIWSTSAPDQGNTFQHHDTVEELFAAVRYPVEREAEHLEVRYDRRYGIPLYMDVDVRSEWVDDEHGFIVEDFRVLE